MLIRHSPINSFFNKSRLCFRKKEYGKLGEYSYFWEGYELFLPVDITIIKSKTHKKILEKVKPFVGISVDYYHVHSILIRECAIFHKIDWEIHYLWFFKSEEVHGHSKSWLDEDALKILDYNLIEQLINYICPNKYGLQSLEPTAEVL